MTGSRSYYTGCKVLMGHYSLIEGYWFLDIYKMILKMLIVMYSDEVLN